MAAQMARKQSTQLSSRVSNPASSNKPALIIAGVIGSPATCGRGDPLGPSSLIPSIDITFVMYIIALILAILYLT